ncbi:MAG: DUF2975 domain-containing protein [Clostridia bacterium]|nr:DUF2975 domain-containing protein [Clostridia bacterium]
MKILGEKSLSSKVEKALKAVFLIIALIEFIAFLFSCFTLYFEYNSYTMLKYYFPKVILITILIIVLLLTGIVALFIIYQFIKTFENLKKGKIFEKENIKYLDIVSKLSIIIGALYLIGLVAMGITLHRYVDFDSLATMLLEILVLIFSVVFFVFGIGIRILNEIYTRAIEYKEENDLMI